MFMVVYLSVSTWCQQSFTLFEVSMKCAMSSKYAAQSSSSKVCSALDFFGAFKERVQVYGALSKTYGLFDVCSSFDFFAVSMKCAMSSKLPRIRI